LRTTGAAHHHHGPRSGGRPRAPSRCQRCGPARLRDGSAAGTHPRPAQHEPPVVATLSIFACAVSGSMIHTRLHPVARDRPDPPQTGSGPPAAAPGGSPPKTRSPPVANFPQRPAASAPRRRPSAARLPALPATRQVVIVHFCPSPGRRWPRRRNAQREEHFTAR
jgi:hypothetical protein